MKLEQNKDEDSENKNLALDDNTVNKRRMRLKYWKLQRNITIKKISMKI